MVDWRSLLKGATNGFDTAVLGVRVGDPVEAIPFDRVSGIETSPPGAHRMWTREGVVDVAQDGRRTPVPRKVQIQELHEHGGCVFVDMICYVVERGIVRAIRVRGAATADLPIRSETDIERAFGAPIGIERVLGVVNYHFPALGLLVAWDPRDRRVESIGFGPVDWTPPVYGAKEVLQEWLASGIRGRFETPEEPKDRKSSAWVRYARVRALLLAFGLGSPAEFGNGAFLHGRPQSACPRSAAEVARIRLDYPEGYRPKESDSDLPIFFGYLLDYRFAAERLLRHYGRMLECSIIGAAAALELAVSANSKIAADLTEIDELLAEMISPEGKKVALVELVEKWGWPEVDLEELEREETW